MNTRSRIAVLVAVLLAVVVPGGAAAGIAAVAQARAGAVENIPAAIVDDDVIVHGDTTTAAGRALTAALVDPQDPSAIRLDWTLTSRRDAARGLRAGDYQAVLTIPAAFSKDVVSTGTDHPRRASVHLRTRPDASLAAAIGAVVTTTAATALGQQVTTRYVDQTLQALTKTSAGLADSADSAADLSDGAAQAAAGAAGLSGGTADLADGLGDASSGAYDLSSGAYDASSSAYQVEDGADALASSGADLAAGAASVSTGATATAQGVSALSDRIQPIAAACPAGLALCDGVRQVADQVADLDQVATETATGASTLADGATGVADGAADLSSGTVDLASGLDELAASSDTLADGVEQSAEAAQTVADDAASLADGAASVADGAASLQSGLADAAGQVPSYTDAQRKDITRVVSDPVTVTGADLSSDPLPGLMAGLGLPLLLWVTAIAVAAFRRRALVAARTRSITAPAGALLGRALWVPSVLGAVQGAVVGLGCALAGADPARPVVLVALTTLGGAAFAVLTSAVLAWLPRAGTAVLLAVLVVQTLCSAVVLPLVTAPPPLAWLGSVLPVDVLGQGVLHAVAGGPGLDVVAPFAVLGLWLLLGVAAGSVVLLRGRSTRTAAPRPMPVRGAMLEA